MEKNRRSTLIAVLIGQITLTSLLAQSPTFRYFYDDTNQLIKVLDTTGNLIEYVYDATGNPTQVNRSIIPAGSLALLNFTPRQGGPGTVITIDGQGFSTTTGNDVVMFNGVVVTVLTATATELTVNIPAGVTSGTVTVSVGGQTVSSGTIQFSALLPPTVTSLIPDGGITGTAINLTINGTNLDAASFATSPGGGLTFNGAATFVSANGLATITGTPGRYAVVATNPAGSSSATLAPANRFTVLDTSGEGDTFRITVLNTAAPPAGAADPTAVSNEASSASVAVLNKAAPPAGTADPTAVSNEASSSSVAVLNKAAPPVGTADPTVVSNEASSGSVAVLNTQPPPPGTVDPSVVANEADTTVATVLNQSGSSAAGTAPSNAVDAIPLTSPPSIHIAVSGDSARLLSGQTATVGLGLAAGRLREAQLVVNGVPFELLAGAPFETTFTVPFGVDSLDLRFNLLDGAGKDAGVPALLVPVTSDPQTQVAGRVVDGSGQPIAGRHVTLEAQGLLAEYFQFHSPLTGLPDVAGLKPVKTSLVSGLNLKNPEHVFGNDPLGLGLGPDYAARYRGEIRIGEGGGRYAFFLRSHKGSRLTIDGSQIAETAPADGEFAEARGDVVLGPGWHKIEVLYYETVGAALLDLTWAPAGGSRQAIPSQNLLARDENKTAISDQTGEFQILNVPSNLDQIQVRIEGEEPITSAPAKPVPGGVSRIGSVTVGKR